MKTSIKFLFIFAVLVLAAGFFIAGDASAQGTYACRWYDDGSGGECFPGVDGSNCETGYVGNCDQFKTSAECGFEKQHTCELDSNKFRCTPFNNFDECVLTEETCLSGYAADCSQFGGALACPSSTTVLDCESVSGSCFDDSDCPSGQRCRFSDLMDPTSGSCVPIDSGGCITEGGSCTDNKGGCCSGLECHVASPEIPTFECKSSDTSSGTKTLGYNQTTCKWVRFSSIPGDEGCTAVNTCTAGNIGLKNEDCLAKSKTDCEATPITQCETVENWGTEQCFRDCSNGDPNLNSRCNTRCGTNNLACNSDSDCLGGADGWECGSNNICKFTGKAGFDCRSGGLIPCGGLDCPCTFCDIFVIINRVVDLLLFTIAPILVSIMVIVGGFFVLTSRGAGQLRRGKEFIKWAILGYLLMLIAWVLVNTILSVLDLAEWVGAGDWWDPTC